MRRSALVAGALTLGCATADVVFYDPSAREPDPREHAATADRAALFLGQKAATALGLTVEDFAVTPPLGRADVAIFGATLKLHADEVGRCLAGAEATSPEPASPRLHWLSAIVAADGVVQDARLADPGADPAAAGCVRTALAGFGLPAPEKAGRVWFRVSGLGPPGPEKPSPPGPYKKPRMKHAGCVARGVRLAPRPGSGARDVRATVKFAVHPGGEVSDFQVLEPLTLPTAVGREVERVVKDCDWVPGEGGGVPISIWVVLPLRWVF